MLKTVNMARISCPVGFSEEIIALFWMKKVSRSAELDFMLDLERLIKETAADPDLIEIQCCIEDNNTQAISEEYKQVAKKLTLRWGITMVDDRIIIPKSQRYAALNALHFGHPGINKMCNDTNATTCPMLQH